MKFTKLSATGNDFILFDNRTRQLNGNEHDFFQKICQRRLSIGADGVLLLNNSAQYHFSMVYYNSDGHLGEMCGNGARAASWYAYQNGIAPNKITFDVLDVLYHAEIIENNVRLQMPPPVEIIMHPGAVDESYLEEGGYLNVGVPHYVVFAENIDEIDVYSIGKKYRHHSKFQPWGANTNFVQIVGKNELNMRTYERGVEQETLACGTGTISSAIVAYKQKGIQPPIKVIAKGGTLFVDFDLDFKHITLTGKVNIIYEGELLHQ